ncbi:MAG: alpha/beta fold hydrolase [Elusimicrobiota bacterium]
MTVESQFWFGDTLARRLGRHEKPSPQALIVYHGFPGQPPPGEEAKYAGLPKFRVELARAVAARLGWDAYLPGYDGLGESRGTFSFERAVERSAEFARAAAARGHERVHVAGHSWGAFVAANVGDALGASGGAVVLLAGLLDLPDEAAVRAFLPYYVELYPNILGADSGALERAAADLDAARRRFNPMSRAASRSSEEKLLIVSARRDTYVDPASSRRYQERFGGRHVELDDDHTFSLNMPRAIDEVARFLEHSEP